jgi:hypothetical protein
MWRKAGLLDKEIKVASCPLHSPPFLLQVNKDIDTCQLILKFDEQRLF